MPRITLFQVTECYSVPKGQPRISAHKGKASQVAVTLFYLFLFLFFFPLNVCMLLALDKDHLWVPVICKHMHVSEPLTNKHALGFAQHWKEHENCLPNVQNTPIPLLVCVKYQLHSLKQWKIGQLCDCVPCTALLLTTNVFYVTLYVQNCRNPTDQLKMCLAKHT